MRSVSLVHAFRRRSIPLLLGVAAIGSTPALARPAAAQDAGTVPIEAPAAAPLADVIDGPAPDVRWTGQDVEALLAVVEAADEEGLDPASYEVGALRQAVLRGVPPSNGLMIELALKVAHDFRYGRVPSAGRVDWRSETPDRELLRRIVVQAAAEHRIGEALTRLLPTHPQYLALKRALAETPASDAARRAALRVNLERWRWMKRDLGDRHLLVNVPAYRVELVDGGTVVSRHAAVVGKPSTPTPAFSTSVTAVRLNPAWAVPPGLEAQKLRFVKRNPAAARRMGYSITYGDDGPSVRQRPGPANALGKVRLVMPNPFMIYLHDTPEKALFARSSRALSQGCVRTEKPVELAARLVGDDGTDPAAVAAALADRSTQEIGLTTPVPVHIAYLTAEAAPDGGVRLLPDPYRRDAGVLRALDGPPDRVALASKGE